MSRQTVPGSFDVIGMVSSGSQTVTVNGTTPYRKGAVTQYVWGRDLAGGVDGAGLPGQSQGSAGGVGGLVGIRTGTTTYGVAYDGNGNVMGLVDGSTGTVAARYEYGPFGEVVRATGPMSKINPFRFSTKYQDDETDLVYFGFRFYNASTGRWPSRDPIGERGGANLYGMVRNNPVNFIDPFGLYLKSFPGGPDVFWNKWTQQQRNDWFKDFKNTLGPIIDQAANSHCVPKELLSTIIANEMIDYTSKELFWEKAGFGDSVGPGQITAETVIRENVYGGIHDYTLDLTQGQLNEMFVAPRWPDPTYIRQQLIDPKVNIDAAAQLLKSYLDKLCSAAGSGAMTASFKSDVAPGCNLGDFCCRKGKSCKDTVNFNAPRCLVQALSAVWNNGPKLATDVNNIPNQSPNGYNHGLWAGDLDGVFDP